MPKIKPPKSYKEHKTRWVNCQGCELCKTRSHVVLARGQVPCDLLFIGEAPGHSENIIGKPFVGPAGQLLDLIIRNALSMVEGDVRVAMTSVVACMPTDKGVKVHDPSPDQAAACFNRLKEFVRLVKPRGIILVGKTAGSFVYGEAMFSSSGTEPVEWVDPEGVMGCLEFREIPHPAAIMRSDISTRGLLVQRATVTVADLMSELLIPF